MNAKPATAAVILAAGEASRMGSPKQLLTIGPQTLLQKSIENALAAECHPVIVVLGAHADLLKKTIQSQPVELAVNEQWQEGMGSSIRTGFKKLVEISPETATAIILLCDQPLVTPTLLLELTHAHTLAGKPIVACRYKDGLGAPALFHDTFFAPLMDLKGKAGAKKLMQEHMDQVIYIPFEEGAVDLDTPEDYEHFQKLRG